MSEKKSENLVKWFSELSNKDVPIAGGKGASLAEMYMHKFPIPPGFVITAQAYQYFIERSGLSHQMKNILDNLNVDDTKALNNASEKIRAMISNAEMPKDLADAIVDAYEVLDVDKQKLAGATATAMDILKKGHEPPFVAVRSSATTEDLATASFAGQQETFLNVKGSSKLLQKVKDCFASLFTSRAVYYRTKKGFPHEKSYLAVVVQKMVNSDKSGVIFSKNPVSIENNIVIEAVFGLGEGIVSGQIKPDHYVVSPDMHNFKILESKVSEKRMAIIRDSSGNNKSVKLSHDRAMQKVLENYEIKRLAQYALQLEEHYRKPQDIEFAIEGTEIYIVQSRPITTTAVKNKDSEVKGNILLNGLGASPGIASGIVKIVYSLEDLEKVKQGDILVTKMTNPDMVVSMEKASAIVTDEGGITCFTGDTKVLTNRGFMQISDAFEIIKNKEDLVLLAYDAKEMKPAWKRIISAGRRKRNCMRVSVSQKGTVDDNIIDITPDHKMLIFDNRNLIKERIDSVLQNGKHICLLDSLPKISNVNDEKKAYLIGALLTDGSIKIDYHHTGKPRRGRIIFTQKNIPEKEEFIKGVRNYFEEVYCKPFRDGRIKYSNSYIRGRLIQGVAEDYMCDSLEIAMKISQISQNLDCWTMLLDEKSSLNFLGGLIDGDGCFYRDRLHIYIGKENILQGAVLACLNIGIFPQVTRNRDIYHVQILERISDILNYTKRVKGELNKRSVGTKLLAAKQIFSDVIEKANYKGRIKPYIENNLLLDSIKIKQNIMPLLEEKEKQETLKVLESGLRSHRAKKISDLGELDVYNLEVEANNEMDHNFVVFSKKYTPILVSNSHASIVSREMGIPAVVGTNDATTKLHDGEEITVDGNSGRVYQGKAETKLVEILPIVHTRTKIKVIVDLPDFAQRAAKSGARGVGLVRLEGIIAESGKHPLYFVKEKNMDDYITVIAEGLRKIAEPFDEIWVRTSDIRSDEYRNLKAAPQTVEGNPMLGNHGVRFSLQYPEIMKAELAAIKEIAEDFPSKILGIMVPQVILLSEVQKTKQMMAELGMPKNIKIGIMVETPAAVQIIESICKEGINFISFGTNDLTQYTLAIDRNNSEVQYLFNEINPAVVNSIAHVIKTCRNYNVETSICGQAGSREDMVKILLSLGISSISVNADAACKISQLVASLESTYMPHADEKHTEINTGHSEEKKEIVVPIVQKKHSHEHKDIEEAALEELGDELEDEYDPGAINDNKQDIPPLNDAISIDSEDFNKSKEEEIQVIKIEEEKKEEIGSEWHGEGEQEKKA